MIGISHGLNHFFLKTKKFERFTFIPNEKNGISSDEVFTLKQYHKGLIWIGIGGGGLNKCDTETSTFESYHVAYVFAGNDVYGIEEDNNGLLRIGTDYGISNSDPINK